MVARKYLLYYSIYSISLYPCIDVKINKSDIRTLKSIKREFIYIFSRWVAWCANFKMAPAYSRLSSLGNLFFILFSLGPSNWTKDNNDALQGFQNPPTRRPSGTVLRDFSRKAHAKAHFNTAFILMNNNLPSISPPPAALCRSLFCFHFISYPHPSQSMDSVLSLFSYLTSWLRIGLKYNKALLIHISMYSSVLTISLFGIPIWTL